MFPSKENRDEQIKKDIQNELNRLYELANKPNEFKINPYNKEVIREYESEIKALMLISNLF